MEHEEVVFHSNVVGPKETNWPEVSSFGHQRERSFFAKAERRFKYDLKLLQ